MSQLTGELRVRPGASRKLAGGIGFQASSGTEITLTNVSRKRVSAYLRWEDGGVFRLTSGESTTVRGERVNRLVVESDSEAEAPCVLQVQGRP